MHFSPVLILLLSCFAGAHELSRPQSIRDSGSLAVPRRLVPFSMARRSHQAREVKLALAPKDTLDLAYRAEYASFPSTVLKFSAHQNLPIISLEDIDHLLATVLCDPLEHHGGATITLSFFSSDACAEALDSWSTPSIFTLITLHPTCNLPDQRGAWRITAVQGAPDSQEITLDASAIPLSEIGHSFHISHNAAGVSSLPGNPSQFHRRDIDDVFTFGHDFDFAPRQKLFPVDDSLLSERGSIDAQPLDSDSDSDSDSNSDADGTFEVFCVNCISQANFSVGIEVDVTGLNITAAHVNFTVLDFQHRIELEFSLNASLSAHESVDVIKAPLPGLGLDIDGIGSIGLFWGGHLGAELDITGELNFSIGAEASIPSGASATFVLAGDEKSSATGWDLSFDLIPFRLNSGSFSASAQLSLSPFLELDITLLDANLATARIDINTPQMVANASVVSNVNRQCQAAGPNDLESFSSALTFGAAAAIDIQVSTSGALLPDLNDNIFTDNFTFSDLPPPSAPECFVIANDDTAVANAPDAKALAGLVPAATGTLVAATQAVPTFNIAGIESYYSANGALPTNVNYTQLVEATAVPSDIKDAVDKIVKSHGQLNRPLGAWGLVLLVAGFGVTASL
ncbi:hypothetical protein MSAN_02038800 [Mycena sanguinolenta]|uniref:Gpi anchored protein n=1 Tax=Mycena sanguinolenta TaxID=230812 RepID=A0A8H6XHX8_9AGAR|nr:hypothetical protein MSAN_02038800 [Mycena sanguinolenta]